MRKDGFILIQVLFMLVIVSSTVLYLIDINYSQAIIEIAYRDKIQADYLSEKNLNRLLYDNSSFKSQIQAHVINHLQKPMLDKYEKFTININFDEEAKGVVNGKFYMNNNRKYLELSTETNYMGFNSHLKSFGTIIKDIFELCGEEGSTFPLISSKNCPTLSLYLNELNSNLKSSHLPTDLQGLFVWDYEKIRVNSKSSSLEELHLVRNDSTITKTFDKDIFFIIKNKFNVPTELEIGKSNKFDPLRLSGIIYIEGDLVISGSFEFNGILILNREDSKIIINTPIKPIFRGVIFSSGEIIDLDSINLTYNTDYVYKFGVYLPGFIDPKVEVTKKY